MTNQLRDELVGDEHGQVTKIALKVCYRVYFLWFCTIYDKRFSKYATKTNLTHSLFSTKFGGSDSTKPE